MITMTAGARESARNAGHADSIVLIGNINPASLRNALITPYPYQHENILTAPSLSERKLIMDNKIEVFKNEQFGEVRTILEGETLLFCGSDVARALGYAIPSKAVNTHCKGVSKMEAPSHGGTQTMLFITEGDVYRLIVRSKLPTAEKFEHWLFDEVVPTIRKTGGYMTDSLLERIQNDPAVIFEIADALLAERRRSTELETELSKAKPKADYFDAFINPDDCTNIRTTAKELKIPERKFVQFLLKEKFLFRSPSGQLLPYNKHSNDGLFIVRDFVTFSFTGSQTYFTPKGKEIIRLKYMKKQNELAALSPKES